MKLTGIAIMIYCVDRSSKKYIEKKRIKYKCIINSHLEVMFAKYIYRDINGLEKVDYSY